MRNPLFLVRVPCAACSWMSFPTREARSAIQSNASGDLSEVLSSPNPFSCRYRRFAKAKRSGIQSEASISGAALDSRSGLRPAGNDPPGRLAEFAPPAQASGSREPIAGVAEKGNKDIKISLCQSLAVWPPGKISSVITLKLASVHGPNEVTIATSVASRPRAIRMRPIRGMLWRASKVCQRPPR